MAPIFGMRKMDIKLTWMMGLLLISTSWWSHLKTLMVIDSVVFTTKTGTES